MGDAVLLNWFGQKKGAKGKVAIEFGQDGVALAYVLRSDDDQSAPAKRRNSELPPGNNRPRLLQCEFLPIDHSTGSSTHGADDTAGNELLNSRIEALGLQQTPCNVVLPAGSYQLFLVEAPKVEPSELRDALRWRVKDLISYPIEDAAIDVMLLPEDKGRAGPAMAYVVVVEKSLIQNTIEQVQAADLKLESIDISELALRNLVINFNRDTRGIALVKLQQGRGNLQIMREGNLYLCRQFDLNYNGGLLDDLPEESLVLELQRSLDYYERQMRQAAPTTIYFCGENISDDKLTAGIKGSLPGLVKVLEVKEGLESDPALDDHILPLCISAIGGALREAEAAS